MGFTLYSTIIYLFLFIADLFAFVKGKENKKMIPFIVITTIIIISIIILGYLWITSPMYYDCWKITFWELEVI